MTRVSRTAPLLAAIVALALAGCAAPATAPGSTPEPQSTAAGDCSQVAVVVDFGPLDEPAIAARIRAAGARLIGGNSLGLFDAAGELVYIAPSRVNLQLTQERWPGITFAATREHAAAVDV